MSKIENQGRPESQVQNRPIRLWPGVLIVALQWLVRYVIPILEPKAMLVGVMGGMICGLAFFIWWAFFSRTPRLERWGGIALVIAALFGTSFLLDHSIATANMGLMFIIFSIPVMCLAIIIWAIAVRNLSPSTRLVSMTITILVASGFWIFLRTNGMTGDGHHDLAWRWAKTDEERLLEQSSEENTLAVNATKVPVDVAEWTGFRGEYRDGIIRDLKIISDWSESAPIEIWRHPVGPGCSSFAIRNGLVYTQEQRGDYEVVSCYNLENGQPVWKHEDKVRFYDSHAGAGPRSTPTLSDSCIYTLGATGLLNALDAKDGSLIWSRNASSDAGITPPTWGIASSPLVVGDIVIVALTGKLAAYDKNKGDPLWFGTDGGSGYSSPHLLTLDDVPQVVFMSDTGAVGIEPGTGKQLWKYHWSIQGRILQPALTGDGDLMICGENKGIRLLKVYFEPDGWKTSEIWESDEIKAVFNDFVIHKGFAYGFDGPYLSCISLKDGKLTWRGERYRGFTLLLAEQDLILVLTEKGELALVKADPEKFTELSKFQAIEGKTWNHPAMAGNILVVRNAREMAAFRLPIRD